VKQQAFQKAIAVDDVTRSVVDSINLQAMGECIFYTYIFIISQVHLTKLNKVNNNYRRYSSLSHVSCLLVFFHKCSIFFANVQCSMLLSVHVIFLQL